jgi:hypothetical protein
MKSLVKVFLSLWLGALVALPGVAQAMTALAVAYDEQTQPTIPYDAPSLSAFGYDAAPAPVANEKENSRWGTGHVFAKFADFLAAKTALHGHHPLPKFLGGGASQLLSKLDPKLHTEFHQLLRQNLKDAGIPLNVGGRGGSAADWAQYMQFNPAAQRTAFDSVLNASRAIDTKYGTRITQDVWKNVMQGNFTPYP